MALPGPGPVQSSSTASSSAPPKPSWMTYSNGGQYDPGTIPHYDTGAARPDVSTIASTNNQIRNAQMDYYNQGAQSLHDQQINNHQAAFDYAKINDAADANYAHDLMNYASMGVGRMPAFQGYAQEQGNHDVSNQRAQVALDLFGKNSALDQLTQQAQNRLNLVNANAQESLAASAAANKIRSVQQ